MTISSTTNKVSYTGDGSTTVFPYTFRIDDDDDVRVILITTATGVGVVQTKTTHYTVSGVGATAGGNITMVTAPTSAQKLFLCRSNMPLTQETDYVEYSSFPASTHEAALDKLTMVCQQQQEQIDRSLKAPQNLEISDGSLADADIVANNIVIVNSSANGFDTQPWHSIVEFTDVSTVTPDSTDFIIYQDSGDGNIYKATIATALATSIGALTGLSSVGTGSEVYKDVSGTTARLRSLLSANSDLTLTQNTNDITFTVADSYLRNNGDVGTGVYDFGDATSFEIPNSADPTLSGTGQVALDSTVTDFTGGVIKYTTGGNTYGVIAMPLAQFTSPTNNYVPVYNSTTDQWEMAAQAGASGGVPGGANNQIQFNSSGVFGGEAGFTRASSGAYTITSSLTVGGNSTAAGQVILLEDSDNGSNKITVTTPASLAADYTFTLPAADCVASTFGASLLDDADASAGRTTLGLGTIATQAANSVSISGGSVTGITDLAVADGGTGASTVDGVLTNLSLSAQPTFRNVIINGDMRIDQRNAAAAVTINAASSTYSVDRWHGYGQATDGVFTLQQSTTAPTGFSNSLKITATTADASIGATQLYILKQRVEGYNVAHFNLGTANAITFTVSFYFRSSVTGNHSFSIGNTVNLSYPFTINVAAADTWARYTTTIVGGTTGTWNTTTGVGLELVYVIGAGSSQLGTANTWANYPYGVTGNVNLIATLNATAYLTGVQIEVGSVATNFEYRLIKTELALCERYYEKTYALSVTPGTASSSGYASSSVASNTVGSVSTYSSTSFSSRKRTTPTIVCYGFAGGSGKVSNGNGTDLAANSGIVASAGEKMAQFFNNSGGTLTTVNESLIYHFTADAEL